MSTVENSNRTGGDNKNKKQLEFTNYNHENNDVVSPTVQDENTHIVTPFQYQFTPVVNVSYDKKDETIEMGDDDWMNDIEQVDVYTDIENPDWFDHRWMNTPVVQSTITYVRTNIHTVSTDLRWGKYIRYIESLSDEDLIILARCRKFTSLSFLGDFSKDNQNNLSEKNRRRIINLFGLDYF